MNSLWLTVKEFVTSKKFIAAIAGIIIALAAKRGLNLPETTVQEMIAVVIAYILGQGWTDRGKEAAKIAAVASQADTNAPAYQAMAKIANSVKA